MYKPNCGLNNLMMSWGHDEYLYRVLKHNNAKLPDEALLMIRFHSFYPWHAGNDYSYLTNEQDKADMKWVLEFKSVFNSRILIFRFIIIPYRLRSNNNIIVSQQIRSLHQEHGRSRR